MTIGVSDTFVSKGVSVTTHHCSSIEKDMILPQGHLPDLWLPAGLPDGPLLLRVADGGASALAGAAAGLPRHGGAPGDAVLARRAREGGGGQVRMKML